MRTAIRFRHIFLASRLHDVGWRQRLLLGCVGLFVFVPVWLVWLRAAPSGSPHLLLIDNHISVDSARSIRGKLPPVESADVVLRYGNKKVRRVALTLDDGWYPDMRILDLLKRNNIHSRDSKPRL